MRVVAFLALLAIAFGCMGFLIRAMHKARAFNPPDIVNKFADDDLDPVVTESLRRREMEMLSADSFDDVVPASITEFRERIEREEAEQRQRNRNTA